MVQAKQLAAASIAVVLVTSQTSVGDDARMLFPGRNWEEATTASQGVDPAQLAAAVDYLKEHVGLDSVKRLAIVRNGRLIWQGSEIDRRQGVWSCTKSFTSTVLGLLIDDGKVQLDTPAHDHLPALAETYPDVTLRHFATMTSGYYAVGDEPRGSYTHGPSKTPFTPGDTPLFVPPGSRYAYWDSAMNQFGNILTRVAGEPIEEVFRRRIADPIGMDPDGWDWGDFGSIDGIVVNGGSGNSGKHIQITARQFARFGHLLLNRGNWDGEQLISADWIAQATAVQVPASTPWGHSASDIDGRGVYGLNWWVNAAKPDGERLWPGAPTGTFAASGHNNNKCFVIPEWKMVVVRLGLDGNVDNSVWSGFFERLATAIAADPSGDQSSAANYFPPPESKGGWRTLDNPDEVRQIGGMDPGKLQQLREWLLDSDNRDFAAVVIRHGHIVLEVERGNSAKTDARRVASVSKAVCATVLGIAAEQSRQGKTLKQMTFDDPAFDFVPQAQPLSDPRKAQITVKQLLNHTSGLTPEATGARNQGPWKHVMGHDGDPKTAKLAFDPGTNCGYSTFALYHASLVCENVTGKPYDQFAIESLFKPIGCEHWWFQQFEGGGEKYGRHPSHAMGMPARDLARIAYCMLNEGRWNDTQVIPKWFVEETAQPTHAVKGPEMRFRVNAETFSHGWELPARLTGEDGTPSGHGIPADARYKPGSGGQLMAFVPSLDLVVTRQTGSSGQWQYAEYLRRACAAVLPDPQKVPSRAEPKTYPKWSTIELNFPGPDSQAQGTPNPFAIRLDVAFSGPGGRQSRVPGFYAGDGSGGEDGNVWKVRFSADEVGTWTYHTTSSERRLDGISGQFVVTGITDDADGFWKWGRLESIGTPANRIRYLKFRDGPFWLKAGCDDPENFLGSYNNFDTPAKRKAAVDYLAAQGINSLYIMTHNLDGDDKDVWPWLGASAKEAKANSGQDARFDIAKLEQWRELFEYMQRRGVVPYLILEDDSAWKQYDHVRYFREMIARFGDLPAVLFNLGEEHNENYTLLDGLALAKQFKEINPYGHPLGIHNINRADDRYVDSPHLDFTAIQTGQPGRPSAVKYAVEHNQIAVDWIQRCEERGRRVLVVNFDEGRPELDRRAWWSAYLGGGVWEAHVPEPYDQPHSAWETTWKELGGTRAFMESLPFHTMRPRNDLVTEGVAFCLADPGTAYALYLPHGGSVSVDLAPDRHYTAAWWNPANKKDGKFQGEHRLSGGRQRVIAPHPSDWALRIIAADVP